MQDNQEIGWHDVANGRVRSLPNNGQGDCLFRAVSHQLKGAVLAPQLRHEAVNYMATHLPDFHVQLLALGWDMIERGEIPPHLQDGELPHMVMHALRLPWTWGGAEAIAAMSRHLRRRIIVYREDEASVHFTPVDEEALPLPPLRLLHRMCQDGRRTHYESVLEWQPAGIRAAADSIQAVVPEPSPMPEPSTMPEPSLMPEPSFEPISKEPPRKSLRLHRPDFEEDAFRSDAFSDEEVESVVMRGSGSTDVANCAQRITQGLANMPFCTVDISLYAVHASRDGL